MHMRTQKHPRIDPDDGKTVDNKTKSNAKREEHLILVNVRENKILADESGRDGKSRNCETGHQKYERQSGIHQGVAVEPVEVDILFHDAQETQAEESDNTKDNNTAKVPADLVKVEILVEGNRQGDPEVIHDDEDPTQLDVFPFGEGFKWEHQSDKGQDAGQPVMDVVWNHPDVEQSDQTGDEDRDADQQNITQCEEA